MESFDLFKVDGQTLSIFVSVCETGSVSRTADIFELNQSTISHTIEKLRAAVKDPLFVKAGRGIAPTEKALQLLPRVQRILGEIEGLVEPESYDARFDNKPFSIAIPTPALLEDMRLVHKRLLAASPDAVLDMRRLAPRERVTEMLTENEADVVIAVSGLRYPSTLNHCHYGEDKLVVFYDPACRDAPMTTDEYACSRHGVVAFGGRMRSEVGKALAELGLRRKIAIAAPTASMLGELIKGTDVIATMPAQLANGAYSGLAVAEPPLELPDLTYELVWHRRYEHSGRNAWLRTQLLDATRHMYARGAAA